MKKQSNKKLRYKLYTQKNNIKVIIEKRYNILIAIITIVITIMFVNLFYIQVIEGKEYKKQLVELTQNIVEGSTAPRGRIYDRNHKLIVDNEVVKTI